MLDDSTDESVEVAANIVAEAAEKTGLDIQHIRRDERVGFRGWSAVVRNESGEGEFIAIFDADFLPEGFF